MKNNITELVFILDKSGSMAGLEKDTVGGFNSMLEKQKREKGKCLVSTVLFSGESKVLHDRISIDEIGKLTTEDYCVGGCTALIDAVAGAIKHTEKVHRYIRKEDVPDNTLFVITTDGEENASHRYSSDEVKSMIEEKKKLGWEFLFLGANIDAVETAKHYGISEDRAVNYHADSVGTKTNYEALSDAVCCIRQSKPLKSTWKKSIERDFKKRK